MSLANSDINTNTSKKLLWALGLSYLSVPIIGWLCFCLWVSNHVVQDPGYLIYSLPDQIALIAQARLNPVVLLPPYALFLLIFIVSFQLFKLSGKSLKVLTGLSMLISLVALPFASAIVYSLGVFFIMSISLLFSDFRIK